MTEVELGHPSEKNKGITVTGPEELADDTDDASTDDDDDDHPHHHPWSWWCGGILLIAMKTSVIAFMNSISHTHTHAHILLLQNQVYSRQHMQGVYHTIWLCLKQSTGQSQFFHFVPIKVIKMAISMVVCPILILAQPYHPSKIRQASIAQWSWNWQPHHHPFATTVSTCDNQ